VQIARHTARPFALDTFSFPLAISVELHGDRLFAEDRRDARRVRDDRRSQVCRHRPSKGRDLKENLNGISASANPEGLSQGAAAYCGSRRNSVLPFRIALFGYHRPRIPASARRERHILGGHRP